MSDPKAVGGEVDRIAALLERDANMLRETGWPNVPENMQAAASLLRSQALEIQKAQAERDEARGCEFGDNCACAVGSRHLWLEAFASERKAKTEVEAKLKAALASPSLPTEIPEKNNA